MPPKGIVKRPLYLQDARKLEPRKGQMMIIETINLKVRCTKESMKVVEQNIRISWVI
jgi:hypothetical protein